MGSAEKTSTANHRSSSAVIRLNHTSYYQPKNVVSCSLAFQDESALNMERVIKRWFANAGDRSEGRRRIRQLLKRLQNWIPFDDIMHQ